MIPRRFRIMLTSKWYRCYDQFSRYRKNASKRDMQNSWRGNGRKKREKFTAESRCPSEVLASVAKLVNWRIRQSQFPANSNQIANRDVRVSERANSLWQLVTEQLSRIFPTGIVSTSSSLVGTEDEVKSVVTYGHVKVLLDSTFRRNIRLFTS